MWKGREFISGEEKKRTKNLYIDDVKFHRCLVTRTGDRAGHVGYPPPIIPMSTALEKHYTPKEVGKMWRLSEDTIREIFRDDPNVLKIIRPEGRFKRAYVSIRIPESVVIKRHAELRQRKAA